MSGPSSSEPVKWCTCLTKCNGGSWVHPRTYTHHKKYKEGESEHLLAGFIKKYGALPQSSTDRVKVSFFYSQPNYMLSSNRGRRMKVAVSLYMA
jgi:hypothetical protein